MKYSKKNLLSFYKQVQTKPLKWKQQAITVAGGNGLGRQLNELWDPWGIFVDQKKNVIIADCWNHRIVEWKYQSKERQIIAGGNGQGNRIDLLSFPRDVVIDEEKNSLIIADNRNRRVIRRWLNDKTRKQEVLIENIDYGGVTMDKEGLIYVSDWKKNEVRRWKEGDEEKGQIVAGGNGKGDDLNQLNVPTYLFVDKDQSVYVTDRENHRVMKWRKDAKEGIIVAGGHGEGNHRNQLFLPHGVIADHLSQIYAADWGNNRVMRRCEGKVQGEIVVGGNGRGNRPNQLDGPIGLSFDGEGNLYVADEWNHRIQKYEVHRA